MAEKPILFNSEMVRALLNGRKTQTRRVIKPQPRICLPEHRSKNHPKHILWRVDKNRQILGGVLTLEEFPQYCKCPYGKVGDKLWVRETFGIFDVDADEDVAIAYKANNSDAEWFKDKRKYFNDLRIGKWRSSLHMYKWAARIWLETTGIRVERVQDISEKDAIAEGIELWEKRDRRSDDSYRVYLKNTSHLNKPCDGPGYYYRTGGPTVCFQMLWDSINAKPKPVLEDEKIAYYVSYPWEEIRETKTYRGRKWYVYGNPWVWVVEFRKAGKVIKDPTRCEEMLGD